MKRMLYYSSILLFITNGVGCSFYSGGYDPNSGLPYGGIWLPTCGGLLDPLGLWCGGGHRQNCGCGGRGVTAGGCCSGINGGTALPQTFITPNGCNGCNSTTTNMQFVPQGNIQFMPQSTINPTPTPMSTPVPTPMSTPVPTPMPDGHQPGGMNSSSYLQPQPIGTILQGANAQQRIKAY